MKGQKFPSPTAEVHSQMFLHEFDDDAQPWQPGGVSDDGPVKRVSYLLTKY